MHALESVEVYSLKGNSKCSVDCSFDLIHSNLHDSIFLFCAHIFFGCNCSWIDKETEEERTKPKIRVEEFHLLESRAEAELRSGGGMDMGGARRSNTNRTPWNISTGYKTRNENMYQDDNEDNDPFSAVGSGPLFK